ncbi:MAG TPA: GNAT family N-acetyltransferase [Gaiellaceae bacterium]|nr:GNAT family N-acetyltransferase [Gaiellaceae bacterium]
MAIEVRPCVSAEELRAAMTGIWHYFGGSATEEDVERFRELMELERMHAAFDGERIVGGAGAFTYRMSVPGGGSIPAGGVTVVGVLPTHRRRGVLTSLMRAQLEDCRARGEAAAYLWASEATIYPRFGYGLASRVGRMALSRDRTRFALPFEPRGTVRLVDLAEAARTFPPLYEAFAAQRPGVFSRSVNWWEKRRLFDSPISRQHGEKNLALLELDGEPAGYAIYFVKQEWDHAGFSTGSVRIEEAVAFTPEAERELWRWLLDFDWTSEFVHDKLPLDHSLFLLLAEPRRMRFVLNDGVWVRLLDVEGALSARSYQDAPDVVLEVGDAFFPENGGRYRVGPGGCERTDADADVALEITGLGSVYLGGFSFADLQQGSRLQELRAGGVERADALFRTAVEPWCLEIF